MTPLKKEVNTTFPPTFSRFYCRYNYRVQEHNLKLIRPSMAREAYRDGQEADEEWARNLVNRLGVIFFSHNKKKEKNTRPKRVDRMFSLFGGKISTVGKPLLLSPLGFSRPFLLLVAKSPCNFSLPQIR